MENINCRLPDWYDENAQQIVVKQYVKIAYDSSDVDTEFEYSPGSLVEFTEKYCLGDKELMILDHGSGYGRDIDLLRHYNGKIFALDFDKRMMRIIINTHHSICGKQLFPIYGNIFSLPFRKNIFDIIISSRTLFLCGCWAKVLEAFGEIVRTIKTGGYLYLSLLSYNNLLCKRRPMLPGEPNINKSGVDLAKSYQVGQVRSLILHTFSEEKIRYLAKNFGMKIIGKITEERNHIEIPYEPFIRKGPLQFVVAMKKIKRRK